MPVGPAARPAEAKNRSNPNPRFHRHGPRPKAGIPDAMNAPVKLGQPFDATRGPPAADRPRPLCRQHRAGRCACRPVRALAARPCAAHRHRQGGGPRLARRRGDLHRRRPFGRQGRPPAGDQRDQGRGRQPPSRARASADAAGQGAPCRRHRRHGRGRHARPGARRGGSAGDRLRGAARRRHGGAGARTRCAAGPRRRAGQPDVPLGQGRRRGDRCRLRPRRACLDALHPLAAPDRALHGDARGVVGLRRRRTTSSPSPSPRRACRSRIA